MSRLDQRKSRLVFTTSDTVRERGKLREVVIEGQQYFAVVRLAAMGRKWPYLVVWIYMRSFQCGWLWGDSDLATAEQIAEQRAA